MKKGKQILLNIGFLKVGYHEIIILVIDIVDTTGTDIASQQPSVQSLAEKDGWVAAVKKNICAVTFVPINKNIIEQADILHRQYV